MIKKILYSAILLIVLWLLEAMFSEKGNIGSSLTFLGLLTLLPLIIIKTIHWFFTKKKDIAPTVFICSLIQMAVHFILFAVFASSALGTSTDRSGGMVYIPFVLGMFIATIISGIFAYPVALSFVTRKSIFNSYLIAFIIYVLSAVGVLYFVTNS